KQIVETIRKSLDIKDFFVVEASRGGDSNEPVSPCCSVAGRHRPERIERQGGRTRTGPARPDAPGALRRRTAGAGRDRRRQYRESRSGGRRAAAGVAQ